MPERCSWPPGPLQRRSSCRSTGAEHRRHGLEQGPHLRAPVARPLDGARVEAERDVVDEYAAVHLGEVDPPLAAVDERVEGADDVVAVDAEVEGEVVARARRDAGVGKVELGGDGGDDRLRAVAACHRQRVGPVGDRIRASRLEVVAGCRARSARSRAAWPPPPRDTALGLAAARQRVEEQDRLPRSGRVRQVDTHTNAHRVAGEAEQHRGDQQELLDEVMADHQQDRSAEGEERDRRAGEADPQAADDRVPGPHGGDGYGDERDHAARERMQRRSRSRELPRRESEEQRDSRRQPACVHRLH